MYTMNPWVSLSDNRPAQIQYPEDSPTKTRAFVRAAEILQELFYIFEESTLMQRYNSIKRSPKDLPDNEISTLQVFMTPPAWRKFDPGERTFVKPPAHLFESDEEKHAILTHVKCDNAMIFLNSVATNLLEGEMESFPKTYGRANELKTS